MRKKLKNTIRPFAFHDEFKARFPRLFMSGLVYHYTTKNVLLELTKSDAKFYATYFRALNDDQEYVKGFSYVVEKYLPKHKPEALKLLRPFVCENGKWLNNKNPNTPVLMPWVMSFSREADSLYQWRSYTDMKDGGYALGFDFGELESLANISVRARHARVESDEMALAYELHFLPCIYLDENNKDDTTLADQILDFMFNEWYEVRRREANFTKKKDLQLLVLLITNLFSLITKDASFRSEHEVRLVLFLKNPKYHDRISFIGGTPRLEIPFQRDTGVKVNSLIRKVILSPHGDRCLLRALADMSAIRSQLHYEIELSRSPFNGR